MPRANATACSISSNAALVSKSEADREVAAASRPRRRCTKPKPTCASSRKARAASNSRRRARPPTARERISHDLETTSARLEIRAPIDGTIDSLPYRVGEKPARGATVAVLLRNHRAVRACPRAGAHAFAREDRHAATLRVDGVDRAFKGQVRFIASEAEFTPYYSLTAADRSKLSFLAEVVFDDAATRTLPSGVPVDVTLELASP